jgi:hypothetical protein
MSQDGLFEDPGRVPPRMATPAKAPRYARRTRSSVWCDDCVRSIHLRGFAYAEPIRKATWVRVAGDGTSMFLCEVHKSERQGDER